MYLIIKVRLYILHLAGVDASVLHCCSSLSPVGLFVIQLYYIVHLGRNTALAVA